jgi:hypothetical protein
MVAACSMVRIGGNLAAHTGSAKVWVISWSVSFSRSSLTAISITPQIGFSGDGTHE